jgi:hypothetical protein
MDKVGEQEMERNLLGDELGKRWAKTILQGE